MMKVKTFEELHEMNMRELFEHKSSVVAALDEQRKEKDKIIGQIMFYQNMIKENQQ